MNETGFFILLMIGFPIWFLMMNYNEWKNEREALSERHKTIYDKRGFSEKGIHKETQTEYDKNGYNQRGYEKEGYDINGYDLLGYDRNGYNRFGFDIFGYSKLGYDKNGYNKYSYDANGKKLEDKYSLWGYDQNEWNIYGYHKLTKTKFDTSGDDGKTEEGVSLQEFTFKPRQKTITRFKDNEFDQYGILKTNQEYSNNYKKMIDFLEKGDEAAGYMYSRPLIEKILNYVLQQNKHFLIDETTLSEKIRFIQSNYSDFTVDKNTLEDFIYIANKVIHDEKYNNILSPKQIAKVIDDIMQWFAAYNYNMDGFNQQGIHKNTLTLYDKQGYDKDGYDKDGYDREGYNKWGYSQNGYDRDGYDTQGYNKLGYDKWGFDKAGYNKNGYDKFGYDDNGYNEYGFSKEGIHKETHTKYDKNGKDEYELDRRGFHINGINAHTCTPYDNKGYNYYGFSKDGIHEETGTQYDPQGYNAEGFDQEGLNKDGFDRIGHHYLLRKIREDKYLDAVTIRNMLKRLNELYQAKADEEIYDTSDEKLQKMAKNLRHNVNRIIHEADEDVNIELARKLSEYIDINYMDARITERDLLVDGVEENIDTVRISKLLEQASLAMKRMAESKESWDKILKPNSAKGRRIFK